MKPIIIIGAGRSGTNMLRDILTSIPNFTTWDCDEINPIWKHKNVQYRFDDIPPELATQDVKNYIRKQFDKIASKKKVEYVVEKTCANSLRLPFVYSIVPDAKYLILLRNGYDVTMSSFLKRQSPISIKYSLKKLRYVPFKDVFYYTLRFGYMRIYQMFSRKKAVKQWGPMNSELNKLSGYVSKIELSAYQWAISVNSALDALAELPKESYMLVQYEVFVNSPAEELLDILSFLGFDINDIDTDRLTKKVSAKSIGAGESRLNREQFNRIEKIIQPVMDRINNLR